MQNTVVCKLPRGLHAYANSAPLRFIHVARHNKPAKTLATSITTSGGHFKHAQNLTGPIYTLHGVAYLLVSFCNEDIESDPNSAHTYIFHQI